MQLDLLRTYGASRAQIFWKLRLPASMPYFFASLKIAMAASLVGAIVGELPTGAVQGLGARMLIGSQFGQPLMMWAALFAAAILAAVLIVGVGLGRTADGPGHGCPAGGAAMTGVFLAALAVWAAGWTVNALLARHGGRAARVRCRCSSASRCWGCGSCSCAA